MTLQMTCANKQASHKPSKNASMQERKLANKQANKATTINTQTHQANNSSKPS
jgi:hypothetical protein